MKSILIIGGSGFIGRHLVPVLQGDYRIMILHRGSQQLPSYFQVEEIITERRNLHLHRQALIRLRPVHASFPHCDTPLNLSGSFLFRLLQDTDS